MYKALIGVLLALVLSFGAATSADAQVPQTINYQGRLRQADGSAVTDGTYTIKFTLYDDASAGNSVWTETHSDINVTGGLFNTLLGETSPLTASIFPAGSNRWLGMKVGADDEITPRQKLASAPYVLRSDTVSPLSIGTTELKSDSASLNKVSGGALTVSGGNVSVTGTVSGNGSLLTNLDGSKVGAGINGANLTDGTITAAKLGSGIAVPVGVILPYGSSTAPAGGWLLCDGSSKSTTTYAALFAVIGYTYGGSGSTFNLPDLRQRFPLGKAASGTGSTLGGTGGAIDHTHTGPSHTHTYSQVISHTHSVDPTSTASGGQSADHTHSFSGTTGTVSADHTHTWNDSSNSPGDHTHSVTYQGKQNAAYGGGSNNYAASTPNVTNTSSSCANHTHTVSGTSGGVSANHTHGGSGTTSGASATHTHATDIVEFTSGLTGDASGTTTASGTGATGLNNPPFLVVSYFIKS